MKNLALAVRDGRLDVHAEEIGREDLPRLIAAINSLGSTLVGPPPQIRKITEDKRLSVLALRGSVGVMEAARQTGVSHRSVNRIWAGAAEDELDVKIAGERLGILRSKPDRIVTGAELAAILSDAQWDEGVNHPAEEAPDIAPEPQAPAPEAVRIDPITLAEIGDTISYKVHDPSAVRPILSRAQVEAIAAKIFPKALTVWAEVHRRVDTVSTKAVADALGMNKATAGVYLSDLFLKGILARPEPGRYTSLYAPPEKPIEPKSVRSVTSSLMGDPPPGRSALDRRD